MKSQPLYLFDLASLPAQDDDPPHIKARDEALARVRKNAGEVFRSNARAFVRDYLRVHGETSGEVITDACKEAGITPHDDRAFGAVFFSLAKEGTIEKCGTCVRKRGHGTSGGNIWRIKLI